VVGNSTIYLHDVAHVRDGFAPQTNIVRRDGGRGTLVTILKTGNASTLDVVAGIRAVLPRVIPTLPPELKVQPLADQSIFVRAAVSGVVREAIIAACLTATMILLFLGSWRSTVIIAVSIPLSILTSVITLSLLGETINIMTLGGLALAVGILVDDATVEVENINRNLDMGKPVIQAILDGAQQIAVPALVSTLCICIVFLPMFFLGGVARYLFVPLAEAVIFAMLASYLLSRTLVPTIARYLLSPPVEGAAPSRNPLARAQQAFERGFERIRLAYRGLLTRLIDRRAVFIPVFLTICLAAFLLVPRLGQNFFPDTDSGQLTLHLRAKTGTRIEETARLTDLVEAAIRREIPAAELDVILDNIGMPYSAINWMHGSSGVIGAADADILVSLKADHRPTADYVRALRQALPTEFPGVDFYFLPADIVTQILNFGLPAPIDVQIEGADIQGNRRVADQMLTELRQVPGLVDLRIQQRFDYPKFEVAVDRTKAAQGGFTTRDVATSLLVSLSGSFQTTPTFFLNWQNGVSYNLATQTPQYRIQSSARHPEHLDQRPDRDAPGILADVTRSRAPARWRCCRTTTSAGSWTSTVPCRTATSARSAATSSGSSTRTGRICRAAASSPCAGSSRPCGRRTSGLLAGLGFSIVLVYLLIVVNFQSWLDPFIIITALPAALAGIVVFLFLTGTTLSVPALMGAIMSVGVATANSILVVAFARERLGEHGDVTRASVEAGFTRFRPVLMTALAMMIGMVPMALGLGEGGEQNAPLGRAVIGGLLCATVATLMFVPAVFALLHGRRSTGAAR
jgi:multidrug efflux pump subunit AcrB